MKDYSTIGRKVEGGSLSSEPRFFWCSIKWGSQWKRFYACLVWCSTTLGSSQGRALLRPRSVQQQGADYQPGQGEDPVHPTCCALQHIDGMWTSSTLNFRKGLLWDPNLGLYWRTHRILQPRPGTHLRSSPWLWLTWGTSLVFSVML